MNRKERRATEKSQEKKNSIKAVTSSATAKAEALKAQGMALKAAGREAEAIPLLTEALKHDSSLADVHFTLAIMARMKPELGIVMENINLNIDAEAMLRSYSAIMVIMRQKRQYKEAVICQEEICRIKPNDAWSLMDLGLLLNIAGQHGRAALEMSRALNMNPDDKIIKGIYSSALNNPPFDQFYPEVKKAILECFKNTDDVHLRNFWLPWINLMMKDPDFHMISKARIMDNQAFKAWADNLDKESGKFLSDPYFTGGVRLLVIANDHIENILTRLRQYMCMNLDELLSSGRIEIFKTFIFALAEQCFFNEYVYSQTEEEIQVVEKLLEATDPVRIGLSACYIPLHKSRAKDADILHELAKDCPEFYRLVTTQFDEPMEEKRLKETLPVFGSIANEISQAVQNQYEENPYPRWTTTSTTPLPQDELLFDEKIKKLPFKILIAGCGTGRHAIGTAVRYPNSTVTAIDLSRASLAYGLRKANEYGISQRIKFIHADILSMKDWPEEFDIIECSGVLHHMEDPFLGWQTLTGKLKPGGLFKIGLYSDIARQPIVKARQFIKEMNYPSTAEGIRACRQAILALPPQDHIREFVSRSGDFFAMSPVRDLIFHVQEHRMTLPQINEMLKKLNLSCVRFALSNPDTLYRYDKMFPDDINRKNLENWEKFEQKYPLTFAGMYQFWCQKQA